MKKWIFAGLFLTIAVTVCFAGGKEKSKKPDKAGNSKNSKGPLLLTVDFNSAVPLKYNFVSSRRITINLDPSGKYSRGEKISGKE